MKALTAFILFLCTSFTPLVYGQDAASDETTHNELRALREAMVAAFDKLDIDSMLEYVHPNAVFTAMNAEVCHGREEIRAYFNRMMTDPDHIVTSLKIKPTVDALTILYGGDTGVAYGSSVDHYQLVDGSDFEVTTRWSATVVKENNRWQIANFHSSANIFDNPVSGCLNRLKLYLRKIF